MLLVALVALAVRLAFALRVAPFIAKDSQSYFLPAWDLVHNGEFQLGLRRTPGYPVFLGGVLVLLGYDLRGVVLAQHLIGAATAALTYLLGRLTFGRPAGLGAGLLVALSAPLLVYEHYLLTEALFGFVLTTALVALVAAWRDPTARRWLLGGLLVGLASLVRPVGQVLLPLALLAALASSLARVGGGLVPPQAIGGGQAPRLPGTLNWKASAFLVAGFALLVVPWAIRNQLTYNLASPSTFGRTLIARTAYYDRGFTFYDAQIPRRDSDPRRVRAREIVQQGANRRQSDGEIAGRLRQELDLGPVEVNALMRDLAIEAILRDPLHFADGTLRFSVRIFNGIEMRIREHEDERRDVVWDERTRHLLATEPRVEEDFRAASRLLRWYQPAQYAPLQLILFALGLVAAVAVPAWRPALLPGFAVIALIVASAALDGPQERYRYPADPAIGVLAMGGLAGMAGLVRWACAKVLGRGQALTRVADVGDPRSLNLSNRDREPGLPLPGTHPGPVP